MLEQAPVVRILTNMQIRNRLTFQFLALVATILSGSLLAVYSVSSRYREDAFYIRLEEKAFTLANIKLDAAKRDSGLLVMINRAKKDAIYKEYGILFDSLGRQLYPDKNTILSNEKPPWADVIADKKWLDEIRRDKQKKMKFQDYEIYGSIYQDEECQDGYIALVGAIDLFGRGEIRNLRNTLIIVFFVVVLAAAVAGWVFSGRALAPILKVIYQVDKISTSNLSLRLEEPQHKDEIYMLTKTFNTMLARIENGFKIQKTFVANASHELKNMLTVITAQLEVLALRERSVEEYQRSLHSVMEDIKNLNEVSHRLLELAKISGEESQISFEKVHLDEILWIARTDTLKRNPLYKVMVDFEDMQEDEEMEDAFVCKGNALLLKTALLNLMENACKFSEDHTVRVKMKATPQEVFLQFADRGIGIPPEDSPFIFEPFYRSQNTRNVKGHGIGLSLVHRIIRIHQGSIEVRSVLKEGTVFVVSLPKR